MKILGFRLPFLSVVLGCLLASSCQDSASQESETELQIQGRALATWVAAGNIERGVLDSDPAFDVLVAAGPTVLKQLGAILRDDPSTLQQAKAADVIGAIAYLHAGAAEIPAVIPALIAGAERPDAQVRRIAVEALGAAGSVASNAIPILSRCAKDENDWVRKCAVVALGRIGVPTPEATDTLRNCLTDPDGTVQLFALQALDDIGRPATNAVPLLIQLTTNPDLGVRCVAVQTLGRVGANHPEAVVALRNALNIESEMFVQPLAREALKKLGATEK
jgi:HEAT repeat protein